MGDLQAKSTVPHDRLDYAESTKVKSDKKKDAETESKGKKKGTMTEPEKEKAAEVNKEAKYEEKQ